jgi:hypothetical protein
VAEAVDDRGLRLVAVDVGDERAVELDELGAQRDDVLERRVAAPASSTASSAPAARSGPSAACSRG